MESQMIAWPTESNRNVFGLADWKAIVGRVAWQMLDSKIGR
jgi:hypothetical protein